MPYLRFFILLIATVILCSTGQSQSGQPDPIKIVLVGDSTMAEKKENKRPETGWGEALESHFDDSVTVSNHALNGRSSKSFIGEGHWEKALAEIEKGDVLVVEFGHNDQKIKSPDRYTEPWGEYSDNLRRYHREAADKGASVIIASSICRRKFEAGELRDTHADYPAAAESVAKELDVPYVDMEELTREMLIEMGPSESVSLFLHLKPGEHENYPDGKTDDTHLNERGAAVHAELFVEALQEMNHPLALRLK